MDLATSMAPDSCRTAVPRMATAIASSHIRILFQSPMLTTSDTAPMVQKLVLLATAPKTNASTNAPHTTIEAIAVGLASFTRPYLGRSVAWGAFVLAFV